MSDVALQVDLLTIFPDLLEAYCSASVLGRARRAGVIAVNVYDLRAGADDPRRSVDDAPFGGGAGMVLAPGPVFAAVERFAPARPLYLLSPSGRRFDQHVAEELAAARSFALLCGRYEGVDQRVADHLVDGELSIGDFVLAGGELAALAVLEATARLVPGVLGNAASSGDDSYATGLLEYPQYTRPAVFRGDAVPEVLLSGDHGRIAAWRRAAALARTLERRPDLITARGGLSEDEVRLLRAHGYPLGAAEAGTPAVGLPAATGAPAFEERDLS
jgi:tRNA (guanine37-N1)-methyltransferase